MRCVLAELCLPLNIKFCYHLWRKTFPTLQRVAAIVAASLLRKREGEEQPNGDRKRKQHFANCHRRIVYGQYLGGV